MNASDPHHDNPTPDWLNRLWPVFPEGEWLSIFSMAADNRRTDWARSPEEAAAVIAKLGTDRNIWLGCATRAERLPKGARGGIADCRHIPGVWLDIDIAGPAHAATNLPPSREVAVSILKRFPLQPTAIIDSGNGLQVWYLFDEPVSIAEAGELLDDFGYTMSDLFLGAGYHIDNVFDSARVLRVPGTYNQKTDPPKPVVLLYAEGPRYGLDDIDQYLTSAPKPDVGAIKAKLPYIGPKRPGDAFNAQVTGGEILAQAGWTHVRTDGNGDQHWKHPTSTNSTSATVFADDGHTTLWTDSFENVPPRRPFDPFGLYAHLVHKGNFGEATRSIVAAGFGARALSLDDYKDFYGEMGLRWGEGDRRDPEEPVDPNEVPRVALMALPWKDFWARDPNVSEWLAEPFLARGRAHALFAGAKSGKSFLTLDVAAGLATGRSVLGKPPRPPVHVMYVDFEMTEDDLRERLEDFGYGPEDDLSHLHYVLLPSIAGLDTHQGAKEVIEAALFFQVELVVIDTTARAVEGEENDADTYRDLSRHLGIALKQARIAWVRLDHAGKNKDAGQRGSSAKNDDVDVVWKLERKESAGGDEILLTATHRRMGWVPEKVLLRQMWTDDGLQHRIVNEAATYPDGTGEVVKAMDRLGLPVDITWREAAKSLRNAGCAFRNNLVSPAIKWRKGVAVEEEARVLANITGAPQNQRSASGAPRSGGSAFPDHPGAPSPRPNGGANQETPGGAGSGAVGGTPTSPKGAWHPPIRGAAHGPDPEQTPESPSKDDNGGRPDLFPLDPPDPFS